MESEEPSHEFNYSSSTSLGELRRELGEARPAERIGAAGAALVFGTFLTFAVIDASQNFAWWVNAIICGVVALVATGGILEFWNVARPLLVLPAAYGALIAAAWALNSFEEARQVLAVAVIGGLAAVFIVVLVLNRLYLKYAALRSIAEKVVKDASRATSLQWPDPETGRSALYRLRVEMRLFRLREILKTARGVALFLCGAVAACGVFAIPWMLFASPLVALAAIVGFVGSLTLGSLLEGLGVPSRAVSALFLIGALAGAYLNIRYGQDPLALLGSASPALDQLFVLGAVMGPVAVVSIELILSAAFAMARSQDESFVRRNARIYIITQSLLALRILDRSRSFRSSDWSALSTLLSNIALAYSGYGLLDLENTTAEQDAVLQSRCDRLAALTREYQLEVGFPRKDTCADLAAHLEKSIIAIALSREGDLESPELPQSSPPARNSWGAVLELGRAVIVAALPIGAIVVSARLGYELPVDYRQSITLGAAGWALLIMLSYLDPKLGTRIETFTALLGSSRSPGNEGKGGSGAAKGP